MMNLEYWLSIDLTTRFIVMSYCDLWSGREVDVTIIYKLSLSTKLFEKRFQYVTI